jgi:hypothetical protein
VGYDNTYSDEYQCFVRFHGCHFKVKMTSDCHKKKYTYEIYTHCNEHAVAQWVMHCATNQKVAGLIPDGVIGIFL